MIKTIIFDIGGVVTHSNFETLYSKFSERIGIPTDYVSEYHKKNIKSLILGKISADDFWLEMRKVGGSTALNFRRIWIEEALKIRKVDHELINIISALRKNYLVGALTNLTTLRLILDEEMRIYDNFDYHFLSCEEHMEKPDPRFYKLALDKVSARPEEAIFVDDQEKCTVPAEKLGMKVILYKNNVGLVEELRRFGVLFK